MVNAPAVERISKDGAFYGTLSAERAASLESDVLVTYGENPADLETFEKDPLLGQIPGLESGHVYLSTDQTDALGMSAPSPLAIPYALEQLRAEGRRGRGGRAGHRRVTRLPSR